MINAIKSAMLTKNQDIEQKNNFFIVMKLQTPAPLNQAYL